MPVYTIASRVFPFFFFIGNEGMLDGLLKTESLFFRLNRFVDNFSIFVTVAELNDFFLIGNLDYFNGNKSRAFGVFGA